MSPKPLLARGLRDRARRQDRRPVRNLDQELGVRKGRRRVRHRRNTPERPWSSAKSQRRFRLVNHRWARLVCVRLYGRCRQAQFGVSHSWSRGTGIAGAVDCRDYPCVAGDAADLNFATLWLRLAILNGTTIRVASTPGSSVRSVSREIRRFQYSAVEYHFRDIGIGVDRSRRILSE
jgi:hypothetical protein